MKKMWKTDEQREISRAMAVDTLRVCNDETCKDPMRATQKAMCDCNKGRYDKILVDTDDLQDAVEIASETFIVDQDVLRDVLRQARLQGN
jgi:hypothetical protein